MHRAVNDIPADPRKTRATGLEAIVCEVTRSCSPSLLTSALQIRIVVDVVFDKSLDVIDLFLEVGDDALDAGVYGLRGGIQTVMFRREHLLEHLDATR